MPKPYLILDRRFAIIFLNARFMDSYQVETGAPLPIEIAQIASPSTTLSPASTLSPRISKDAIRSSLRASTVDGVFAAVFSVGTGGILLGNFLVELDATPIVFGMVSSIPMLVNLFQPMGAYLSERSTSRFHYSLRTHGIGRLLWLILVIGIVSFSWGGLNSNQLVILSLLILVCSHLLGGLGAASWLSWIATLVPRQLRGRYFGLRNSLANLTELVSLPIAGLAVSHWYAGVYPRLWGDFALSHYLWNCEFGVSIFPGRYKSSITKYLLC
jgi:hypothetical protein